MVAPRYAEFKRAVRRFRPSELLPTVSAAAAQQQIGPYSSAWRSRPPWAFAAIGRASLLYGTEHRSDVLTDARLNHLVDLYVNVYEEQPASNSTVASIIAPLLYEQWPYGTSRKEEMARAYLLMAEPVPTVAGAPLTEPWEELLGATMSEVIKATFVLMVGAQINGGIFNPAWLTQDNFREINALIAPEVVLTTARRLSTTIDAARADAAAAASRTVGVAPSRLQFGYNPLLSTPFVDLGRPVLVAPQYQLILRTASPESLYYTAIRRWGEPFADRLGRRVEAYVGRQLNHTGELDVRPEIKWGSSERRSVDWFLVLPTLTVLIECKSARLPLAARGGDDLTMRKYVSDYVGKARSQIKKTARGLTACDQHYEALPTGREIVGLVVTAEPIWIGNAPDITEHLPDAGVPTVCISLRDVERLSVLTPEELEAALRAIVLDERGQEDIFHTSLRRVVPSEALGRSNRLIDDAFRTHLSPITRSAES